MSLPKGSFAAESTLLPGKRRCHGNRAESGHRDELPLVVHLPIVVGNQRRALIQRSHSDDATGSKGRIAKAACARGVRRSRRCVPERIAAERTAADTASFTEAASLAEASLPGLEFTRAASSLLSTASTLSLAEAALPKVAATALIVRRHGLAEALILLPDTRTGLREAATEPGVLAEAGLRLAPSSTEAATEPTGLAETLILLPKATVLAPKTSETTLLGTPATLRTTLPGSAAQPPADGEVLIRKRVGGLPFSKHPGIASHEQIRILHHRFIGNRPIDAAIGIDRQQTKSFAGNRIGVRATQKPDAVGIDKGFDVGRIDAEAALIFLDGADVFLSTEYHFLFLLPSCLGLVGRDGRGRGNG